MQTGLICRHSTVFADLWNGAHHDQFHEKGAEHLTFQWFIVKW